MYFGPGICQGHLSMAIQSPVNLCRSLERLLLITMMMITMMHSSGRVSLFIVNWCSGGLFLRRSPTPSPAPAHGSETSPSHGPSTPRDPVNGEEGYSTLSAF